MFQTVFNSQTVFIIDDPPDWNSRVETEWTLLRDTQAGLTQRESRRPYSATLRVKLSYRATVFCEALRKLQGSLRALNIQPVIVPLWPAAISWSDRATSLISGGLKIVWKSDWSQFEIFTDAEPAWPGADDLVAPALYGFLRPQELQMRNPDSAFWDVEFTESSPPQYAVVPAVFVPIAGPVPPGYSTPPPLLPVQPDFSADSEQVSVSVKRDHLSFTREQTPTFYPQAAVRSQKANYALTATQTAQFLRFFLDAAAPGSAFWAPGWMQVARLTADALASDTVLQVEGTDAIHVGDYISIYPSYLGRQVVAKTGSTLTLNVAPGVPLHSSETCLFPLCLARLDKPVLSLSWASSDIAFAQLQWSEVPVEYLSPSDETLGVTLGRLPTRVILFEFTRDLGNGTIVTDRFTNYEADLDWSGHTWLSRDIDHGEIKQSLNLENDGVQLNSFIFAGNPVTLDAALKAEAPLSLTVRHADFDGEDLSNVKVVFTGVLDSVGRNGQKLTPKFKAGPASLDDQLPRLIRGPLCNHVTGANPDGSYLISYGCTLLKDDWKFTANVAAPITSAFPFVLNLSGLARVTGAAPTYLQDWFALGWVELGAGLAIQRRTILKSTVPVGGALSLTLQRWFETAPTVGDTVVLHPGCDGMSHTCKAYNASTNPLGKFNNYLNFGGEPFTPAGNPSLAKISSSPPQGSKKS